MTKTIYPPDDDLVYSQRFPNIRIGFVNSVYHELDVESRRRNNDIYLPSVYMADTMALLKMMPRAYQSLLFDIGAKIVLNRDHRRIATCRFKERRIRINVEFMANFKFEKGVLFGSRRAARLAYAALFEETAHYLLGALNFSRTPGYKAAMRDQIQSIGKPQRDIMRLERTYNNTSKEGKSAFSRIPPDEQPEELLIDLLRIKDYLAAQDLNARQINGFMKLVFPHGWPVAQEFEQRLQKAAQDVPRVRVPSAPFRPNGLDVQLPHLHRMMRESLRNTA